MNEICTVADDDVSAVHEATQSTGIADYVRTIRRGNTHFFIDIAGYYL